MNPEDQIYSLSPSDIEKLTDGLIANEPGVVNDRNILKEIFSFLDFTTLEGSDNDEKIARFCERALSFQKQGLPPPAAVCMYPTFVRQAKQLLSGSGIRVAAVTGYFPSGQATLALKMEEVKYTMDEGADEIDFVISRGKFLEGNHQYLYDEISSAKEIIKDIHLKVILETGELKTSANIWKAGKIALSAGADVIKTSTGKFSPAATEHAAFIMLHTIGEHFEKTGQKRGFKPAGGIVEPEQAVRYYLLVKEILGPQWLTKDFFRIGASRLADNLAKLLAS